MVRPRFRSITERYIWLDVIRTEHQPDVKSYDGSQASAKHGLSIFTKFLSFFLYPNTLYFHHSYRRTVGPRAVKFGVEIMTVTAKLILVFIITIAALAHILHAKCLSYILTQSQFKFLFMAGVLVVLIQTNKIPSIFHQSRTFIVQRIYM